MALMGLLGMDFQYHQVLHCDVYGGPDEIHGLVPYRVPTAVDLHDLHGSPHLDTLRARNHSGTGADGYEPLTSFRTG